ncbi:hypothetical protein Aglo03_01950 [Actinokineospora globicatena]|uniref:Uncharacterized protein n=1 Tax=Actinokineospora globicatena TaxID=103729 RepID=A0A9W6QIZ5_9PSEU|nr:hypothetical protein Aglo03_01950 [Actinokineospora globicatena]
MLASTLPGVREVRTPLTVGFVWLLVAWLVVGKDLPKSKPSQAVLAALWDLGAYVGKGGLLVVASFAAYLIGAFVEVDPLHLWEHGGRPRWINRLRDRARTRALDRVQVYPMSDQTLRDLDEYTAEEYGFDGAAHPRSFVAAGIMREERQLATRLQAANVELFNRYDRLLAEASFRINVAPALLALILLVVWNAHIPVPIKVTVTVATTLAAFLFFRQGVRRAIQSRDIIAQAVVAEVVKSRFMAKLGEHEVTTTPPVDGGGS